MKGKVREVETVEGISPVLLKALSGKHEKGAGSSRGKGWSPANSQQRGGD